MVDRLSKIPYDTNDIIKLCVVFDEGTGQKHRPAYITSINKNIVNFYKITSKYDSKSDAIKRQYFEIIDWKEAGLSKPSWVDTVLERQVDKNDVKIEFAGWMSDADQKRFGDFLTNHQ